MSFCHKCIQKDDVCDEESCHCFCHPWSRQPKTLPSPEMLVEIKKWQETSRGSVRRALEPLKATRVGRDLLKQTKSGRAILADATKSRKKRRQ